jgi:hypothetical protein
VTDRPEPSPPRTSDQDPAPNDAPTRAQAVNTDRTGAAESEPVAEPEPMRTSVPVSAREAARAEAARRARLAAVFGDVLPETTGDERGPGSSGGRDESWYRDNRPPHHGT